MSCHNNLINADLQLHHFALILWRTRRQHCPLACHTVTIAAAWKFFTRQMIPLQIPAIAKMQLCRPLIVTHLLRLHTSHTEKPVLFLVSYVLHSRSIPPASPLQHLGVLSKLLLLSIHPFQMHKAQETLLSVPSSSPPAAAEGSSRTDVCAQSPY